MRKFILVFSLAVICLSSFSAETPKRGLDFVMTKTYKNDWLNGMTRLKGKIQAHYGYEIENLKIVFADNDTVVVADSGRFELNLFPGKYQFKFIAQGYEVVLTDTIELKANEVNECMVRMAGLMEVFSKPVIYLYPEVETEISVKVKPSGEFLFTYPEYKNGWNITANSKGKLKDSTNSYDYLFWDADINWKASENQLTNGTYVSKEGTIEFLEKSLTELGFNSSEKNDFITYWGPRLFQNDLNYIYFMVNDECNEVAELEITPKPEHILRVYMIYHKVEDSSNYNLKTHQSGMLIPRIHFRKTFTVIEWGGSELKNYKTNL